MGIRQIAFAAMRILRGTVALCSLIFTTQPAARSQEPAKPEDTNTQAVANGGVIHTESRIVLVDAVVTDKKGNYVRDLTQQDFKIYEDNKEQSISSFSFGSDPASQPNGQKRYTILFFDNSSMDMPDQIQARAAATKFIDGSASADRLIAIVDFGGVLSIKQNFTANAELLKAAVSGMHAPNIETNGGVNVASNSPQPGTIGSGAFPSFSSSESDYGARTMLLSIRSLAKKSCSI